MQQIKNQKFKGNCMKNFIKLSFVLLIISCCSAFTTIKNDGLNITYGVSDSDPSKIELKLNKNYTFTYQDLSVSSKEIKLSGTYMLKKNTVVLIPAEEEIKFHNKWKISTDKKTAKSRKWLCFYTLRVK